MKAEAERGTHPEVRPRLERLLGDIREHPPSLIFAGDSPFPAPRDRIKREYATTRLFPGLPDGRGLWILPARQEAFERGGGGSGTEVGGGGEGPGCLDGAMLAVGDYGVRAREQGGPLLV